MVSLSFSEVTNLLAQLQASGKVLRNKPPPQPQPLLLVFPQLPATHLLTIAVLSCISEQHFAMLRRSTSQSTTSTTLSMCSVRIIFPYSGPDRVVHVCSLTAAPAPLGAGAGPRSAAGIRRGPCIPAIRSQTRMARSAWL